MTDRSRRIRLAVLAAAVLAVHVWLLNGAPVVTLSARKAPAFSARTLAPAEPPTAPAAVAVVQEPAAPAREPAVAPAPAPRAPDTAHARPRAGAASAAASAAPAVAKVAEPAAAAHEAGAARAVHASVPPSARYHYDVIAQAKGITLHGSALLEWRNDGHEYEAQLSLSAPFIRTRTQRSTGLVTPQGLAPVRFSDKSRSEEAAHFDRENGKVVFSTNKPEAALESGAQDRLSIVLQLGALMAAEPSRYPAGTAITLQTASTKEAEPWTFTVEGPETLDLPGGRLSAMRLLRSPRKEYDVKVELWLAPGAAYAPVRLRLTQPNGDWVDQQWSSTDRS